MARIRSLLDHDGTWPVVGALAACSGALAARPLPWWGLATVVLVALLRRRPAAWCLVLFVVTDVLAVRALDGLQAPPETSFAGTVTLVTDPEPVVGERLRFEASTVHGRLLAEVRAPAAIDIVAPLLAGDRIHMRGATGRLHRQTDWTRSRHLAGTLRVESASAVPTSTPHHRAANSYRRVLDRGSASLTPTQRSLLSGLVLGDDRAQPPQLTADFRASGLTHLLAVSGQNVAFLLVVVGPVLRTLRLWPRFVVAVVVIAAFALVTRFEPSVLRAAFVAVVALYAHTTGRPSGSIRHLAIAVCGLLIVDPLLVWSLGFRLSVAASVGVVVLAPRIAAHLRGPRWLRDGLAVTAGAQCAVAPVLVPTIGPMPLAALPANLVAGPIAGALMVWGLTAGTLAGVVGGRVAWLLHRPSAFGLDLLDRVASAGASLPLGSVDLGWLMVVALAVGVGVSTNRSSLRVLGTTLALVALLAPVLVPQSRGARPAGWAATVWADGPVSVVDVDAGADPVDVVETLRGTRTRVVGLVILRTSRPGAASVVDAIGSRFEIGAVIGPPGSPHPDVVVVPDGFRARVGRFEVVVDRAGPPLRARVGWRGSEGVAAPAAAVSSPRAPGARRSSLRRDPPRLDRGPGRRARRPRRGPRGRSRGARRHVTVAGSRRVRSCRRASRRLLP